MERSSKLFLTLALCFILSLLVTACGTNSVADHNTIKDNTSGSITTTAKTSVKIPVFEMYDKVNIGMAKQEVDAALDVTPTLETNQHAVKNTFNYKDKNDEYGVTVLYNDQDQAYSKTVIYGSAEVLAPYTAKPVTEQQAKRIRNNMSYQEVVGILGGDGVECSYSANEKDLSKQGVIRRWVNSDGSFIQIVFIDNDKVGNVMFIDGE